MSNHYDVIVIGSGASGGRLVHAFRGEKPGETRFAPNWSLEAVARHAVDFWPSTEDLPRPENRVTLAKEGNVQISYTPSNEGWATREATGVQ